MPRRDGKSQRRLKSKRRVHRNNLNTRVRPRPSVADFQMSNRDASPERAKTQAPANLHRYVTVIMGPVENHIFIFTGPRTAWCDDLFVLMKTARNPHALLEILAGMKALFGISCYSLNKIVDLKQLLRQLPDYPRQYYAERQALMQSRKTLAQQTYELRRQDDWSTVSDLVYGRPDDWRLARVQREQTLQNKAVEIMQRVDNVIHARDADYLPLPAEAMTIQVCVFDRPSTEQGIIE